MLYHLISEIIVELKAIQGVPVHLLTKGDEFGFPRIIGVGEGRALHVNKKIDELIAQVAGHIHEKIDDFRQTTGIQDLRPLVRSAVAAELAKVDLDGPVAEISDTVVRETLSTITSKWTQRSGLHQHCFACTLFGFDVAPFEIGAVRFEARNDWLSRRLARREIGKVTANRIAAVWHGQRLRKRKRSWESVYEREILDLIGSCRYVISVTTDGLTQHFGQEKALIAARIALTAIALLWRTPSKRLAGFNLAYDREVRSLVSMTIIQGRLLCSYSKINLAVDGTFRGSDWLELYSNERSYFALFAEIISFILKEGADNDRQRTLRKVFHATLWFHEGCRETSPLIATVKYAACMDALASGKGDGAILAVFERVLGWKRTDVVFSDGTTLETAVLRIYKQGRSRTIHGNNDQAHLDWSTIAARAEQLARHLLLGCLEWAAEKDLKSDIAILAKRK